MARKVDMPRFLTGLAKRPKAKQLELLGSSRYVGTSDANGTVIQPLADMHDQLRKPSCVGHAWAQVIESVIGARISAVDIWEGARSLQGHAGISELGTRGDFAWLWLTRHGWTDWVPGEDSRPERSDEDWRVGANLADAMLAHKKRRNRVSLVQTINTWQPTDWFVSQVVAALHEPNTGLVRETPTTDEYMSAPTDKVLGKQYFAGDSGWHAERVAGYSAERDAFLIVGSWGDWTRCSLPDGSTALGCCWVSPEALKQSQAIDVIRVR